MDQCKKNSGGMCSPIEDKSLGLIWVWQSTSSYEKSGKWHQGRWSLGDRIRALSFHKLKSQRGDSIAEVLVSLLISVFAITMLATMISTAMTLVKRSNEVTYSYLEVGNDLISPGKDSELKAVKETGTVTIKVTGLVNSTGTTDTDTESTGTDGVAMRLRNSDTAETTVVYYYTNSSISGNNVTAYYVKSED